MFKEIIKNIINESLRDYESLHCYIDHWGELNIKCKLYQVDFRFHFLYITPRVFIRKDSEKDKYVNIGYSWHSIFSKKYWEIVKLGSKIKKIERSKELDKKINSLDKRIITKYKLKNI